MHDQLRSYRRCEWYDTENAKARRDRLYHAYVGSWTEPLPRELPEYAPEPFNHEHIAKLEGQTDFDREKAFTRVINIEQTAAYQLLMWILLLIFLAWVIFLPSIGLRIFWYVILNPFLRLLCWFFC